jgi:hypothetical protein
MILLRNLNLYYCLNDTNFCLAFPFVCVSAFILYPSLVHTYFIIDLRAVT